MRTARMNVRSACNMRVLPYPAAASNAVRQVRYPGADCAFRRGHKNDPLPFLIAVVVASDVRALLLPRLRTRGRPCLVLASAPNPFPAAAAADLPQLRGDLVVARPIFLQR